MQELATKWAGYMDGAVRSGERSADEILSDLYGLNVEKLREEETDRIPTSPAKPTIVDKILAYAFDACTAICCLR
jgi:hypothetical protein